MDSDLIELKTDLLSSLLRFTQFFYKLRTSRDFLISHPINRESHYISICRDLTKVFKGEILEENINIPPRYGKTELLIHFVAWAMAAYPDSNFLYISYAHSLAAKQTQTIREIMSIPAYQEIFDISISDKSSAKDNFETNKGGSIFAAGTGGGLTGRGAGIKNVFDRFSGAMLFDDIIKPDEATSDIIREGSIEWYYNTAQSRRNNGNQTPIVNIGQRTHEKDLTAHLKEKSKNINSLVIPALDSNNNALDPRIHTTEDLLEMKQRDPYTFAAQYQQDPQPAGGGIFKPEWFNVMDFQPDCIAGFITVDTAETDKTYNDATVFTFFGIHEIKSLYEGHKYGLYIAHCKEIWVEPKDLESSFKEFIMECAARKIKINAIAIEKKSTGTTFLGILSSYQGLNVISIDRPGHINGMLNNKTNRFLAAQSYIAQKLISLPRNEKHTQMIIDHMRKITANNTHARDDICDTIADACDIELNRQMISSMFIKNITSDVTAKKIMAQSKNLNLLRKNAFGGRM